jgi:hypothetical protein
MARLLEATVTRSIRVWEKKRGHRHTGSRLVGSVGESLFFGAIFVLGIVCLAAVLTSQVVHPTPAIYTPGFGFWLMVLVLTSFVMTGGWGVIHTVMQVGTSVERRSAIVRQAAGLDLIRGALASPRDYPNIPRDAHLTNSPGVILAFRLPVASSTTWRLWFAMSFCLVCSGLSSVLVVVAVNSHLSGNPEWFLTAFLAPLIVINAWSVVYFLRELWSQARIGPTFVEIEDHPLLPGTEYAVFLAQTGRISFKLLEMVLLCSEEATYHQGTDIRTETRVVREQIVFQQTSAHVEPGSPLEVRQTVRIPNDAMHTFQSSHNAVHWRLVVRGIPDTGPDFTRSFPVIVYPPVRNGTGKAS